MSKEQQVQALIGHHRPSFDNKKLRMQYPSLLEKRSRNFERIFGQQWYGVFLPSDTYGVLRSKLIGCVVAIIQEFYTVDNVDIVLSRSDIAHITHVGGILQSTNPTRRFS